MPQNSPLAQKTPISVVVVTRNEATRIAQCLEALQQFCEIVVVDSGSADDTCAIAAEHGARVVDFTWNGQYPKKRQWCLDTIELCSDIVFFVDADEVVTPALCDEIAAIDWGSVNAPAGCFVRGRYVWNGTLLRYGLRNSKLCLINRHMFEFPVVDDLNIDGMGEIEGHYQPVLKVGYEGQSIGCLREALIHDAQGGWKARHLRYAHWEATMEGQLPRDPVYYRRVLKAVFKSRALKMLRPLCAFLHSYILKLGVLDGRAGFDFAQSRAAYYTMINRASLTSKD